MPRAQEKQGARKSLTVSLTGTVHDLTQAQVLTEEIEPAALLADKGDESDDFMANLEVRINPSFRRRQMTRRRASARLRSIASATSSILPEIK